MKSEKELYAIAQAIAEVLVELKCNTGDILVILGMLQSDVYYRMNAEREKREEGHMVKVE